MAINVRYSGVGDLGSLAVQAGEGQDFWRRHAAEQNIASSVRNYYNQQDTLRLESMRLQQAMNATRTPTHAASQQRQGPFAKSVQESKATAQVPQSFSSALAPVEQDALALAIKTGNRDMIAQLTQKALAAGSVTPQPGGTGQIGAGGERFTVGEEGQVAGVTRDATGQEIPIPQEQIQQRGGFSQFQRPAVEEAADPSTTAKQSILSHPSIPDTLRQKYAGALQDPDWDAARLNDQVVRDLEAMQGGSITPNQRVNLALAPHESEMEAAKIKMDELKQSYHATEWQELMGLANTKVSIASIARDSSPEVASAVADIRTQQIKRDKARVAKVSAIRELLGESAAQKAEAEMDAENFVDGPGLEWLPQQNEVRRQTEAGEVIIRRKQ